MVPLIEFRVVSFPAKIIKSQEPSKYSLGNLSPSTSRFAITDKRSSFIFSS